MSQEISDPFGLNEKCVWCGHSAQAHDGRCPHPDGCNCEAFMHILSRACRPGDLVLDPFAGSGASREASLALGLRWEGCDVDPSFAEVA
jgi:modification methylase